MNASVLVLIPTLNRPNMCRRAVDSVLQQTYNDYRLLVVKNGTAKSDKAYLEALAEVLEDERVGIAFTGTAGLGRALNFGLRHVAENFDYWVNLEDDDEFEPSYLEKMIAAMKESGADVVNCLQTQVPRKIQSDGGPMNPEHLKHRNWINWPECLWKASVYEFVGPIAEDVGPATDWDYHLRCTKMGMRYHHVPERLVIHHWHNDNYCLLVSGEHYIAKRAAEGAYE